jgi:hypothetical protein
MKRMRSLFVIAVSALSLAACDEKKETAAGASSANAVVSVPPVMSAPPVTPSAAPSAAPAASTVIVTGADSNDVSLTVKDPAKDPEYTVKAKAGGSFTLFLPDTGGMAWAADSVGTAGKPKEEVIPGFAKDTLGHQFKWTGLKPGKVQMTFGNRKPAPKGTPPGPATSTFKLTLDVT